MTHICVSELTIIGSDNGLSPERRQANIWLNAGLLLIEPLGTNFSEISIGIQTFSFKKMHLNMSSAKWRPFCLGLNVLTPLPTYWSYIFCCTNPSKLAVGDDALENRCRLYSRSIWDFPQLWSPYPWQQGLEAEKNDSQSIAPFRSFTGDRGCHDDTISVVIGFTGYCRHDNLWCGQWRQSWSYDSVFSIVGDVIMWEILVNYSKKYLTSP